MTSPIRKLIGAKLKSHRLGARMTQASVAEALDCEDTTIGRYERGDYSPDAEMLIRLADLFGVTPLDFFPCSVEAHWQTISDLRSTLIDLIFKIDDPAALTQLIATAEAHQVPKR